MSENHHDTKSYTKANNNSNRKTNYTGPVDDYCSSNHSVALLSRKPRPTMPTSADIDAADHLVQSALLSRLSRPELFKGSGDNDVETKHVNDEDNTKTNTDKNTIYDADDHSSYNDREYPLLSGID